jgi:TetR/AcrR family transcriptional regulator, fatty acid metabolism regulator protein
MNPKETSVNDPHQRSFIETARRRQIIDCAIETISDLGLAQASLLKIAKRAEVAESVIRYYFRDKEELQQEVLRHTLSVIRTFLQDRIRRETATLTLLSLAEAYVDCHATHKKEFRAASAILRAHALANPQSPEVQHDAQARREVFGRILTSGQKLGEFRHFDVMAMAQLINSLINSIAHQQLDPTFDFDIHRRELREMIKRAVLKNPNEAEST